MFVSVWSAAKSAPEEAARGRRRCTTSGSCVSQVGHQAGVERPVNFLPIAARRAAVPFFLR